MTDMDFAKRFCGAYIGQIHLRAAFLRAQDGSDEIHGRGHCPFLDETALKDKGQAGPPFSCICTPHPYDDENLLSLPKIWLS